MPRNEPSLAEKNAHPRDMRIEFFEEPHLYVVDKDPNTKYTSVTTWVHTHFPQFDEKQCYKSANKEAINAETYVLNKGEKNLTLLEQKMQQLPLVCREPRDWLLHANVLKAVEERLTFKLAQIGNDKYTWVTEEAAEHAMRRFDAILGPDCIRKRPQFERTLVTYASEFDNQRLNDRVALVCARRGMPPLRKFQFEARMDMVGDTTAWELKCTSSVTIEHMLQLCVYAWIWEVLELGEGKKFQLYNVRTNEQWLLEATPDDLDTIVLELLMGRAEEPAARDDETFLASAKLIFERACSLPGEARGDESEFHPNAM
jgi:hypothetical protein